MAFPSSLLSSRRVRSLHGPALAVLMAFAVAGCQTTSDGSSSLLTGSTGTVSLKTAALAAQKYEQNPSDTKAGLHYVRLLKEMGQTDKALNVLAEIAKNNPQDVGLTTLYGKELAEAGRGEDASQVLNAIVQTGKADWKIYSALGSAYDQQGAFAEAREAYKSALTMKPGEVGITNNMGMSHALEGNLKEAEAVLRQAMALPGAGKVPRVRQNLALVVGLQGRFDEAREIASKDLPPGQVEANMAVLQNMLQQPNTWQQLKGGKAPAAKTASNG